MTANQKIVIFGIVSAITMFLVYNNFLSPMAKCEKAMYRSILNTDYAAGYGPKTTKEAKDRATLGCAKQMAK